MYKRYYTYILSNKNDTALYIGVTNDLERRVAEHRSGTIPGFTQKYNCHKLVYFEEYTDIDQAISREKQLKKWSRPKKEALIDTKNKEREDLMPYWGRCWDISTTVEMTEGKNVIIIDIMAYFDIICDNFGIILYIFGIFWIYDDIFLRINDYLCDQEYI